MEAVKLDDIIKYLIQVKDEINDPEALFIAKFNGVPLLPVYVIGVNIGSGEIFCSMELKVPNEIQHIVKIFQDTMKNTEDKKLH